MFHWDQFEIPAYIRYNSRIKYRVLWIEEFKDSSQLGECDYDNKQIVLKKGMDARTTFFVLLHEILHAISYQRKLNMTEKQVETTETELARICKLNKWC